ncbi:hypothetical protein FRB99_006263 [Tulasnella sp. 403]|nr:hypothetical protein FRB99_006263 [Tulasnella sp. 403]
MPPYVTILGTPQSLYVEQRYESEDITTKERNVADVIINNLAYSSEDTSTKAGRDLSPPGPPPAQLFLRYTVRST